MGLSNFILWVMSFPPNTTNIANISWFKGGRCLKDLENCERCRNYNWFGYDLDHRFASQTRIDNFKVG